MHPNLHRWSTLPSDTPMDKLTRRRIIGEQAMLSYINLTKGCFVPSHSHANEQFAVMLSGRLRFILTENGKEREVIASAGEVLHLPANLPHSAEAIEDSVVLDVFSPPSQTTGIDRPTTS